MRNKCFFKRAFSKIIIIFFCCICMIVIMPKVKLANAMESNHDEFDDVLIETVREYIKETPCDSMELISDKEIIYDIDLNYLGFIYDFKVNSENGYGVVVNVNGYPEVAEVYFNSINPFKDIKSKIVYITNSFYLYNCDSTYYLFTGEEITEEGLDAVRDIAYYSANSVITNSSENVYYTEKTEIDVLQMAKRHPAISGIVGYENACVPIVGANIIQFWDRYKPNLIENYSPGVAVGAYYLYNAPNATLNSMAVQLYNLMGTNSSKTGTTISQFKSGMTAYCSSKGYTIVYESCMNNKKFDYYKAKEKMKEGHPLAIFTDPFTVATIVSDDKMDRISYVKAAAAHSVAGFGFKDIKYTLTNGQTRIDNYIQIASGLVECGVGYYNINFDTIIDDAYGIYIS